MAAPHANLKRHEQQVYGESVHSLKVAIRRNSYDMQSYVKVCILTKGYEWHDLATIPISEAKCKALNYINNDCHEDARKLFEMDEDRLTKIAIQILEPR